VGDRSERCRLLLNLSGAALPVARAHFRVGQTDADLAKYEAIIEAARQELSRALNCPSYMSKAPEIRGLSCVRGGT
jgi:hypothetical protein